MSEYIRWESDRPHHSYADMLGRIRSGCIISFRDGDYRVHDEWGKITMMTTDPSKAINRYKFQCSVAEQQAELATRENCLGLTPAIAKW